MPEMINPLAAFRDGYNTMQGFRDQRTKMQAGNALAGGDYRGGANALLQGGMLGDGMDVMQAGMTQDKARQDQEKTAKAEGFKVLLDGTEALSTVPLEQRRAMLQSQIIPLLQSRGAPPDLLQHLTSLPDDGLTDQSLVAFRQALGGEMQKLQTFQSGGTVVGINPQTGVQGWQAQVGPPAEPPKSQTVEGPDGLYERQADGSWKKVATFGAPARTFAPRAPRGGGGGAPAASTGPSAAEIEAEMRRRGLR